MSIITFSARETPLPSLPSANMIKIALSSDETKLIMGILIVGIYMGLKNKKL